MKNVCLVKLTPPPDIVIVKYEVNDYPSLHEGAEHVHWQREDDRRVLLCNKANIITFFHRINIMKNQDVIASQEQNMFRYKIDKMKFVSREKQMESHLEGTLP